MLCGKGWGARVLIMNDQVQGAVELWMLDAGQLMVVLGDGAWGRSYIWRASTVSCIKLGDSPWRSKSLGSLLARSWSGSSDTHSNR